MIPFFDFHSPETEAARVRNQYEATVEFIAVARNCGRAREERFLECG